MPESNDPLKDVEDRQGQRDTGTMAARVLYGAIEEYDGNVYFGWLATCAFFVGMFSGPKDDPKDEEK